MAIGFLEVTAYSRSRGDSMIPKVAYRSGEILVDHRSGITADYSRRVGIELTFMLFPHGLTADRERIWNDVERREVRRDACVGRQVLFALPTELSPEGRERCARRLAQWMVDENQTFVDCALHLPNPKGDQRNYHLHLLFPTRCLDSAGNLTEKLRPWDDLKTGPLKIKDLRTKASEIANDELAHEMLDARVDLRSNKDRQIDAKPGVKLGVAAIGFERRTGEISSKRRYIESPIEIDLALIAALQSFKAAKARRWKHAADADQTNIPIVKPLQIDIAAILARLRKNADLQIKASLKVVQQSSPFVTRRRIRPKREERPPTRAMRQIGSVVKSLRLQIWQPAKVSKADDRGAAWLMPSMAENPSGQKADSPLIPPVQLEGETIAKIAQAQAYAFALAILDATSDSSTDEKVDFIRWAIAVVATKIGVPIENLESHFAEFRRRLGESMSQVTGKVLEACQHLIAIAAADIDRAKRGLPIVRQPSADSGDHVQSLNRISSAIAEIQSSATAKIAKNPIGEPASPKSILPNGLPRDVVFNQRVGEDLTFVFSEAALTGSKDAWPQSLATSPNIHPKTQPLRRDLQSSSFTPAAGETVANPTVSNAPKDNHRDPYSSKVPCSITRKARTRKKDEWGK